MGDSKQTLFKSTQIVDPAQILSDEEIRGEDLVLCDLAFATPLECMKWSARRKLLKNSNDCEKCNIPMTCSRNARQVLDGYQWICKRCKQSRSIRKDSFFANSHLRLQQILVLVYGWACEYPQDMISMEARLGDGHHTAIKWYNFCRGVCEEYFILNKISIGGLNEDGTSKTVEIDESKFFHKNYHRGCWEVTHWVLGGIERETKKCFLVEVPDRTEATLAAIIERHILPGTIIVSDGRRVFRNIENIGREIYEHEVVTLEENFVDQDDARFHTQNIKNMWLGAKRKLGRQYGTSETLFTSYLHDFAWRNQYSKYQIFNEFLITVAAQYPVPYIVKVD